MHGRPVCAAGPRQAHAAARLRNFNGELRIGRLVHSLPRLPTNHFDGCAEHFMPFNDLPQRLFQPIDIERTVKPEGGGHNISPRVRIDLLQYPEPLLRVRQGIVTCLLDALDRLPLPAAPGFID